MKENTMRSGPICEEILRIHQQVSATLAASRATFGDATMMADDDDKDDDDKTSDDDASGDDDSDDDPGTEGQDGKKKKDTEDDTSGDDPVAKARERMKAADRRATQAERELQEIKDKDKPALERAEARVKELEPKLESAEFSIRDLRLRVAFLSDNTYSWHDPEDALRLVDMDGVDIDDDGKVVGLKSALKNLATTKKHLVKVEKSKDDEDDDESEPSGSQQNGKRKGEKGANASREALAKKYPALRR